MKADIARNGKTVSPTIQERSRQEATMRTWARAPTAPRFTRSRSRQSSGSRTGLRPLPVGRVVLEAAADEMDEDGLERGLGLRDAEDGSAPLLEPAQDLADHLVLHDRHAELDAAGLRMRVVRQ